MFRYKNTVFRYKNTVFRYKNPNKFLFGQSCIGTSWVQIPIALL